MRFLNVLLVVTLVVSATAVRAEFSGDILRPQTVSENTPCVLLIHGGAWSSMKRADVRGIADFLVRDCGFVVYNIDYRLASKETPWPACGDDCLAAARYMFTEGFARQSGVKPKQIWVMGGSAGGHLALWTGLSLPANQVAGIVSISGIADPQPDYEANPGRYRTLFGGRDVTPALLDSMNPIRLIRPNGPRVLCTHAREDQVVPIASARRFATAYREAGNEVALFDYPCGVEYDLTGHCIWRPRSNPHRLIQVLEKRIAYFMRDAAVPCPQPVKSPIEITALYYPGTEHMPEWDMVEQTRPEIKPLLGWYDEGDPEAIDWQIKWAVEHGITSFCVDWYWNKGYQRLTHWLTGYYQAKYRNHLKWYMMYANHNQPGAHSTEDQIAVTRYWIDNYFKTPEYYTLDGKPVVCYWAANNLDNDFIAEAAAKGETLNLGEGIKRAFAISEKMAREAGLPGIHWQLMWNGAAYDPGYAVTRRLSGFSSAINYGFVYEVRQVAADAARSYWDLTFDMVQKGIPRFWEARALQRELPWWLPLPTGWDDRPRSFSKSLIVEGRTVEKFAAICRDARAYCDKHGLRHVVVHPINEWQEGSYIEPNEEYGFGMYDAIRDAFCEKPAEGWPKNLRPSDVGLGPYDFPPLYRSAKQQWEFKNSVEGWYRQPYGGGELEAKEGALHFWVTRVHNYNIRQRVVPFDAANYRTFKLRLRITPNARTDMSQVEPQALRLKWGTSESPIIVRPKMVIDPDRYVASCPVSCDGEYHEYTLDFASNPDWKGKVDELWLETSQLMHARIAIDWMRFE